MNSEFDGVTVAAGLIKQVVSQIEALEEKKSEVLADIKETFAEAKAQGLDITTLKQLIRLRKKKKEDIEEQEELLEIYRRALEQQ
ncbi:MAG: DUF2312 domain-containing protein [Holosporales bacterium]|jgi:uncharacterized protein (UPF0335 family)|nr:DUF2312 domain-containing protein [Holosporales bacterium]